METYFLLQEMLRLLRDIENLLKGQEETRVRLNELWIKFGQTVRQTRLERDMSLVELAERMGTTKSALSYMENGERSWNIDLAMRAVEALK